MKPILHVTRLPLHCCGSRLPAVFHVCPSNALVSCSGADVSLCDLKRLPVLTPPAKTHSSAALNFRPCFYCLSKALVPAALPRSFPFCNSLLSVHSMQQLHHLNPAKPCRLMQLLWFRNFSCLSDGHLQKKPMGAECLSEKEYSFQSLCSVSCTTSKCYLS